MAIKGSSSFTKFSRFAQEPSGRCVVVKPTGYPRSGLHEQRSERLRRWRPSSNNVQTGMPNHAQLVQSASRPYIGTGFYGRAVAPVARLTKRKPRRNMPGRD